MKKIFVLVAVTIMGVVNVNAQSGYEDTTHEIGVSIGEMSNSKWVSVADFMGTTIFSIGTVKYENGSFTGPISVEYFYHYTPVVNLGAIAVFAQESKDIVINGDKSGDAKNTYLTVLPAAKFNWLRTKNFGMYSKLAAGLTYMSRKEDYKKDHENWRPDDEIAKEGVERLKNQDAPGCPYFIPTRIMDIKPEVLLYQLNKKLILAKAKQ